MREFKGYSVGIISKNNIGAFFDKKLMIYNLDTDTILFDDPNLFKRGEEICRAKFTPDNKYLVVHTYKLHVAVFKIYEDYVELFFKDELLKNSMERDLYVFNDIFVIDATLLKENNKRIFVVCSMDGKYKEILDNTDDAIINESSLSTSMQQDNLFTFYHDSVAGKKFTLESFRSNGKLIKNEIVLKNTNFCKLLWDNGFLYDRLYSFDEYRAILRKYRPNGKYKEGIYYIDLENEKLEFLCDYPKLKRLELLEKDIQVIYDKLNNNLYVFVEDELRHIYIEEHKNIPNNIRCYKCDLTNHKVTLEKTFNVKFRYPANYLFLGTVNKDYMLFNYIKRLVVYKIDEDGNLV